MFVCLYLVLVVFVLVFFFCKQTTAYEMRISDWSSDVCSSDLTRRDRTQGWMHMTLKGGGRTLTLESTISGFDDIAEQASEAARGNEIGRAACRERVCQYVAISVVDVSCKTKTRTATQTQNHYLVISLT